MLKISNVRIRDLWQEATSGTPHLDVLDTATRIDQNKAPVWVSIDFLADGVERHIEIAPCKNVWEMAKKLLDITYLRGV